VNRSVLTLAIFMVLEGIAPSLTSAIEAIRQRRRQADPMEVRVHLLSFAAIVCSTESFGLHDQWRSTYCS
jgi:hypothetical protein